MSCFPVASEVKRAAFCLNNIGVAQLARHCYAQAHETLFASAQLLSGTSPVRPNIDKELKLANQRLSNPAASPAKLQLQVFSDDATMKSIHAVLSMRPQHFAACPIRIEATDGETIDRGFMTAIILYNYGLTQACLAKTAPSASKASKLRDGAVCLFAQAKMILCSCKDDPMMPRVLFMGIVILNATIAALLDAGLEGEAKETTAKLTCLRMAAELLDDMELFKGVSQSAAAA